MPVGSRIVDLGCGIGHFQMLCEAAGHQTLGIDIEDEVFDTLCPTLGIRRHIEWILPEFQFPSQDAIDLICGFCINFNVLPDRLWNEDEWTAFLETAKGKLAPSGRIALYLNYHRPHTGLKSIDGTLPKFLETHGFKTMVINNRHMCLYETKSI